MTRKFRLNDTDQRTFFLFPSAETVAEKEKKECFIE